MEREILLADMKFAHDFDASLKREEYPQEWLDSAISYRQLKKCIKRVQQELQGLGLDPQILEQLWQHINNNDREVVLSAEADESASRPYHYCISSKLGLCLFQNGRMLMQDSDEFAAFKPKLTVAINPDDGSPIDAWLSPETRDFLRSLPRSQPAESRRSSSALAAINGSDLHVDSQPIHEGSISLERGSDDSIKSIETVEIPLTSDSEFFQILKHELASLNRLQETEQKQLSAQIVKLGSDLTSLTEATSKRSKAEVEAWREIFRLYIESQVFFSTNERTVGPRSPSAAQKRLEDFRSCLSDGQKKLRLSNNGKAAVKSFLQINASLLQFVKFQEINRTALTKIMKKFDKRTALHVQSNLPIVLANEKFIAQDLAKVACFTIQELLLPIVPQINDYLCPVCFSISFKPVRLRCNHVFCIRCLIVMQRARQDHCPLCRGNVVMEASSGMSSYAYIILSSE